jgi:hypothetical protein
MLVALLTISSSFFAGESEPKSLMKIVNEDSEKFAWEMITALSNINACRILSTFILNAYDSTDSIENKGIITLGACTSVYAAFVASAAYQNMSKSADENQK